MLTNQIVALLIAERDKLNRAIEALTGNAAAKRRGRPPKTGMAIATVAAPAGGEVSSGDAPKKRNGFSAATKRKMALSQKKRWAVKKAAQK